MFKKIFFKLTLHNLPLAAPIKVLEEIPGIFSLYLVSYVLCILNLNKLGKGISVTFFLSTFSTKTLYHLHHFFTYSLCTRQIFA